MSAALGTLERYSNGNQTKVSDISLGLGRWLRELFGCQHKQMSRPFSRHGESYRVCLACGAQRQFDAQTWNTGGPFYYKAARTSDLRDIQVSTLKCIRG